MSSRGEMATWVPMQVPVLSKRVPGPVPVPVSRKSDPKLRPVPYLVPVQQRGNEYR